MTFEMRSPPSGSADPLDGKRYFLGKAFLREVDPGTFGLFRDLLEETKDPANGKAIREKLKSLGPLQVFRRIENDERPDLRTIDPKTGQEISLKCLNQ